MKIQRSNGVSTVHKISFTKCNKLLIIVQQPHESLTLGL
jgi:hypothetical protein